MGWGTASRALRCALIATGCVHAACARSATPSAEVVRGLADGGSPHSIGALGTVAPSSSSPPVTSPPPAAASGTTSPTKPGLRVYKDHPVGGERRVDSEPSRYGTFEMLVVPDWTPQHSPNPICQVSFRGGANAKTPLFVASDCIGGPQGTSGFNIVGAVSHIGELALPVVATNGDEFHVFALASARGGNAVSTIDYWAVVIREATAWGDSIGAALISAATWDAATSPPLLLLLEPPATTAPGARYSVRFGRVESLVLPVLESRPISKTTVVLAGTLNGPFHVTNWLPSVDLATGSHQPVVIDDAGDCQLAAIYERSYDARVDLTAEKTTWSDGRETIRCVQVKVR